ncbi:hypothetical protein P7K49_030254 [Saguinus oedipus]|uniref:Uncharacterized protein n=1 Tax=Saguinus oedipus TaxID=9490 RepID=A0ABQ9U2L0_SAGOE|nr:hypothetical protein P7K49_030254 [Saguinus oedipus]
MSQENGLLYNCQVTLNSHREIGKDPPPRGELPEILHLSNDPGQLLEQRSSLESPEILYSECQGLNLDTTVYGLGHAAQLPESLDHKFCQRVTGKHGKSKLGLHLLLQVFSKVNFRSQVQLHSAEWIGRPYFYGAQSPRKCQSPGKPESDHFLSPVQSHPSIL